MNQAISERWEYLAPQTRANPYPVYRRLREEEPVYWVEEIQGWVLTRYADCERALQEPALSHGDGITEIFRSLPLEIREELAPLRHYLHLGMGSVDPPEHTRIRTPMNKAFTARLIRAQAKFIRSLAAEFIERGLANGSMEVVTEMAYPLPAIVIANLLGTTRTNEDLFLECSDSLGDLFGGPNPSAAVGRNAQDKVLALASHLNELIELRRGSPGHDDLVGMLLSPESGESQLNKDEIVANCIFLLFAGHLTITSLIGTCIYTLISHPETMESLRKYPEAMPAFVEEALRFDGPIQMVRRLAARDIDLNHKRIKKGDMVWLNLGAANHDPLRYTNPDVFDMHRNSAKHLAFGAGIHYCIGASLARIETEIVLETLLRKTAHIRLATEDLEWHNLLAVRALKSLPIFLE